MFLKGKVFNDIHAVETAVNQYFASKHQDFFKTGITMLPERWRKCIELEGEYL